MNEYTIDLGFVFSADDLYNEIEAILPIPAYFGRTLDAFHDVLTDEGRNWKITFTDCAPCEAVLGKYMRTFKKMCAKAMEETGTLEILFID